MPTKIEKKLIGEILVEAKLITEEDVQAALAVQKKDGGKLVAILVRLGRLDIDAFASFLAHESGLPNVDLLKFTHLWKYCELIPEEFARKHELFPIDKIGKNLTVGMAVPLDKSTIAEIEKMTGLSVKPMLCHVQQIRQCIEQYYGQTSGDSVGPLDLEQIKNAVSVEQVPGMLREIDRLPTLPETVSRVQSALDDEEVSLREIAEIIETDPPLSAQVLRLANSAAFGLVNLVDSVQVATTLVGPRNISMMLATAAIIDMTSHNASFDHQKFWRRSRFCSQVARHIAGSASDRNFAASAATAGLLHDIGRYALAVFAPALFAKIGEEAVGAELVGLESRYFGIAHPEAGYILSTRWNLPEEISASIRFHHWPERAREHRKLVSIAALASLLADLNFRDEALGDASHFGNEALVANAGVNFAAVADAFSEACTATD